MDRTLRQLASFRVGEIGCHAVTVLHHSRSDVCDPWLVTRRKSVVVKDPVYHRPFDVNRDFKDASTAE